MAKSLIEIIHCTPPDEHAALTLSELCRACSVPVEDVIELVFEGALEPEGERVSEWRFSVAYLRRAKVAVRLQRDLHINVAGVALALDLLEEIEDLRRKLTLQGENL